MAVTSSYSRALAMPVHGWKGGSRKHIQKSVALQKKLNNYYYSYTLLYQKDDSMAQTIAIFARDLDRLVLQAHKR